MCWAIINNMEYLFYLNSAYYIQQCSRDDPEVDICFMNSANHLARLLRNGVPELYMEEVLIKLRMKSVQYYCTVQYST